jgi:Na+/H+-dicarboxylate symporter
MSRTAINVCGDLVTAIVMDRWVGSKTGHQKEIEEELKRETIRMETGEDVLTNQSSQAGK